MPQVDISSARAADRPAAGTWFAPAERRSVSFGHVLDHAVRMSAVLLGEIHDRAEIHRWQLHVAAALHARRPIALGFEMFPRRLQPVLDRWVAGALDTESFLVESEWFDVWGFDPELYLPLFHFCREQRIPMLALNCHRPLVTRVRREGWAAIPEADRDGLTPAAPATDAYRRYLFDLMSGMPGREPRTMNAAFDGFVAAQQTWDRAFAENIAKARERLHRRLVVGIIGRGHLEFGHGTPYQLRDLGIDDTAVLLTASASDAQDRALKAGIADAVFILDQPEPAPPLPTRLGFEVSGSDRLSIAALTEGGPAAAAGLRAGDLIAGAAGRPVHTRSDLWAILRRLPPGVLLPLDVVRDGTPVHCIVPVPATPPPRAMRAGERPPWPA
jgi:uncharacterized iron-regulated protein